MRKVEITFKDKTQMVVDDDFATPGAIANEMECANKYIPIGNAIVEKANILSIKVIKENEK